MILLRRAATTRREGEGEKRIRRRLDGSSFPSCLLHPGYVRKFKANYTLCKTQNAILFFFFLLPALIRKQTSFLFKQMHTRKTFLTSYKKGPIIIQTLTWRRGGGGEVRRAHLPFLTAFREGKCGVSSATAERQNRNKRGE